MYNAPDRNKIQTLLKNVCNKIYMYYVLDRTFILWCTPNIVSSILGPVVQSPISTNPRLTLNKTYRVNPGLALIGL